MQQYTGLCSKNTMVVTTSHCIALHCIALHCIALHCICYDAPEALVRKARGPDSGGKRLRARNLKTYSLERLISDQLCGLWLAIVCPRTRGGARRRAAAQRRLAVLLTDSLTYLPASLRSIRKLRIRGPKSLRSHGKMKSLLETNPLTSRFLPRGWTVGLIRAVRICAARVGIPGPE